MTLLILANLMTPCWLAWLFDASFTTSRWNQNSNIHIYIHIHFSNWSLSTMTKRHLHGNSYLSLYSFVSLSRAMSASAPNMTTGRIKFAFLWQKKEIWKKLNTTRCGANESKSAYLLWVLLVRKPHTLDRKYWLCSNVRKMLQNKLGIFRVRDEHIPLDSLKFPVFAV